VPTGITIGNVFRKNGGQALETGLWAVEVHFGYRAVERVQRRRPPAKPAFPQVTAWRASL
jgi:hypothetical protein